MENSVEIAFLGDISLNDAYVEKYKLGQKPFQQVSVLLQKSDFVVGNLECLARGNQGENLKKRPRLSTEVETLNYLKDIHLDVACLAHNHLYDHLEDGYLKTTEFLKANGIQYLGAGFTNSEIEKELIIEKDGISVALLNYVTSDTNPNIPQDAILQPNWFDLKKAASKIPEIKTKVDHVVLLLHWGGIAEGKLYPDINQRNISHKLIDAGADLIIGGHSHTIHPFESYKGKYIFYSLGNFCFADIIFQGKIIYQDKNRRSKGLLPIISFSKDEINIARLLQITNKNLFLNVSLFTKKFYLFKPLLSFKFLYKCYQGYEFFYKYFSIIMIDGLNNNKSIRYRITKLFRLC